MKHCDKYIAENLGIIGLKMEIPESNLCKLQPPVIYQGTSSQEAARIILSAL